MICQCHGEFQDILTKGWQRMMVAAQQKMLNHSAWVSQIRRFNQIKIISARAVM